MKIFQQPTTFDYDKDVKPFSVRMRDLKEETGLVKSQTLGHLTIFKYSSKAFYNPKAWIDHPELLECRGVVTNLKGDQVSFPFNRCFNYMERGKMDGVPDNLEVLASVKHNGFLLTAFFNPYTQDVSFSTSGALDGPYLDMGVKWIKSHKMFKHVRDYVVGTRRTMLFEIVHPNDPHIIKYCPKDQKPYLIGIGRSPGSYELASDLSVFPELNPVECLPVMPFSELLSIVKDVRHEGFVVQDRKGNYITKLKSPYYLVNKLLARGKPEFMFRNPAEYKKRAPEELTWVVDSVVDYFTPEEWTSKTETERMEFLRALF